MNKNPLFELFNLRHDQDSPENIDAAIRNGTRLGGTNLWVLMLAILMASIGLNVNSTAVIIGAMLISPLMGPIIGAGYGVGINDIPLIRQALRNLLVFLLISLLTSTLYFWVSPLTQAHSELLARTTPSLWDVLIAFFGGAAGIIALTRKEKSPVIPGVAIATALMPPLCTAGYGLASGNFRFFLGAFLLFAINSVFIALATLLLVKFLKLPQHRYLEEHERRHARFWIAAAITATLLPSAYLTYQLVRGEMFNTTANRLLERVEREKNVMILSHEISINPNRISLTLGGDKPPAELSQQIKDELSIQGFADTILEMRYMGSQDQVDISGLRQDLRKDVLRDTLRLLEARSEQVQRLEAENQRLQQHQYGLQNIVDEILALYPAIRQIRIGQGIEYTGNRGPAPRNDPSGEMVQRFTPVTVLNISSPSALSGAERRRLQHWLTTRLSGQRVHLVFD